MSGFRTRPAAITSRVEAASGMAAITTVFFTYLKAGAHVVGTDSVYGPSRVVMELAREHSVEMPIAAEVFNILFKDKPVKEAIRDLMLRSPKPEIWW